METRVNQLGQKIKRYRLLNDIRQEDMADKMGVSRATLINYEKGHTAINFDVLNRLKNFYPDFELEDKESDRPKIITNSTIDFKVLLKALIEKKIFIIFFTLFVTILGTCSSFLFTKLYGIKKMILSKEKNDIAKDFSRLLVIFAPYKL